MKVSRKDAREVIREVESLGFVLQRSSGHGLVYRHPNGRSVVVNKSPERRAKANTIARARRRARGLD